MPLRRAVSKKTSGCWPGCWLAEALQSAWTMSLWWNGRHSRLKICWGETPVWVRVPPATLFTPRSSILRSEVLPFHGTRLNHVALASRCSTALMRAARLQGPPTSFEQIQNWFAGKADRNVCPIDEWHRHSCLCELKTDSESALTVRLTRSATFAQQVATGSSVPASVHMRAPAA